MDLEQSLSSAREVASAVIAPHAAANDKDGRFPTEAVTALGKAGLLGLAVPEALGGAGLGPRALAEVTAILGEADASVALIYYMHVVASHFVASSRRTDLTVKLLQEVSSGDHLCALAFSERGSRSHFWVPLSRATKEAHGVTLNAVKSWVTSAGHAQSYVVSTLAHSASGPTDSTVYVVPATCSGLRVTSPWDGMGLRASASAPLALESCTLTDDHRLTEEGAGLKSMLEVLLPLFNVGSTAMALGLCRALVAASVSHLKTSRLEHMNASLGEAVPSLRAELGLMQVRADMLGALLLDCVAALEKPGPATGLRVLESKAAAGSLTPQIAAHAMHLCGGAAFSRHSNVERFFRDAQASAVMGPTVDVLHDFIGKALLGLPLL